MRAVFVGASSLAVMTAGFLLRRGHEVVIIESDPARIAGLNGQLDCGFIQGDGAKPAILREADPGNTHFLFCLTGDDRANILASLVGRSLGFPRIVTKIDDPELEHVCIELGLEDTVIPARTIGRYLADTFKGMNMLQLSGAIRDEARLFTFVAHEDDLGELAALKLPAQTRAVCLYRDGLFTPVEEDTKLKDGDEVVLVTHSKHLDELRERWAVTVDHRG